MRELAFAAVVVGLAWVGIAAATKEDPHPVRSMYPGLQLSGELEDELLLVDGRRCGPLWPSRVAVDGGPVAMHREEVAVADPLPDADTFVKLLQNPKLRRYDATVERFATDDDSFLESITVARDYRPDMLFAGHLLPPEHPFWKDWEPQLAEIQTHAANIQTLADLYPVESSVVMYKLEEPYFRAYQQINRTQWVLFALTGKTDATLEKQRVFYLHEIIDGYPSIRFLYALKQALRSPR